MPAWSPLLSSHSESEVDVQANDRTPNLPVVPDPVDAAALFPVDVEVAETGDEPAISKMDLVAFDQSVFARKLVLGQECGVPYQIGARSDAEAADLAAQRHAEPVGELELEPSPDDEVNPVLVADEPQIDAEGPERIDFEIQIIDDQSGQQVQAPRGGLTASERPVAETIRGRHVDERRPEVHIRFARSEQRGGPRIGADIHKERPEFERPLIVGHLETTLE